MQYLLELRLETEAGFGLLAVLDRFHVATQNLRGRELSVVCAADHEAAHLADVSDSVERPQPKGKILLTLGHWKTDVGLLVTFIQVNRSDLDANKKNTQMFYQSKKIGGW